MTDTKVSFEETLVIKVGRFLRKEYPNIAFADGFGGSLSQLCANDAIGLLDAESAPQFNWWQKILQPRPRRFFMGVLWLANAGKGTTYKKWLLEVHGNQHIELLTEVVRRLAQEFDVSVHVKLVSEKTSYETFSSDSDC